MKRFTQTLRIGLALFLATFGTSALPTASAYALDEALADQSATETAVTPTTTTETTLVVTEVLPPPPVEYVAPPAQVQTQEVVTQDVPQTPAEQITEEVPFEAPQSFVAMEAQAVEEDNEVKDNGQEVCPDTNFDTVLGGWVKYDGLTEISFTVPEKSGYTVEELCYKSSNEVVYLDASGTVTSTVKNKNGQVQAQSHVSVRYTVNTIPKDSTAGVTVTPPTCDADGTATVSGLSYATLVGELDLSVGAHQAVFNATTGHQFADGSTTLTVNYTILPMLTDEQCEESEVPVPATPSVNATVLPCMEDTNSVDQISVTVTNTNDETDDAVTYTVTVKNAMNVTVGTHTFTNVADGSTTLSHTFSGLVAGNYTVHVMGDDQTSVNSGGLVVNDCEKDEDNRKVFVCKYVGTPGIDERLQTGQNPISVSVNAVQSPVVIGAFFNDAHGRSVVIAYDEGQEEPSADECPGPVDESEEPTVAVLDTVCIAEGQTGTFTIRVTNNNDFATEYRVNVEGGDTKTMMLAANSYSDFTFTGYVAGTYDYTVQQKMANYDEYERSNILDEAIDIQMPAYNWVTVADGDVTLENCPRVLGETDVCPNLTGTQSYVPAGYQLVNGSCIMPENPQVLAAAVAVPAALPATLPATGASTESNLYLVLGMVLSALTYFVMMRRYQEA